MTSDKHTMFKAWGREKRNMVCLCVLSLWLDIEEQVRVEPLNIIE